jgi:hypothetical protein
VLIHDVAAARVGDRSTCNGPPDTIVMGEPSVLIGGQPAARVGDPTAHGGVIVAGCGCVQIGQTAQAIVMREAAKSGAAFCEECARKKKEEDAKKAKKAKGAKEAKEAKGPTGEEPAPVGGKRGGTRDQRKKTPPLGRNTTGRAIDVEAALAHLNANPEPSSTGWCGKYVNNAIIAGGAKGYGKGHAFQTGKSMLASGFHDVTGDTKDPTNFAAQPGDCIVFAPVRGHDKGHVAMWNGAEWISDYRQGKTPYSSKDYVGRGSFRIYRP